MKFMIFLVLGIMVCGVSFAAEQNETLTITTYYPSPYGSYHELATDILAVGGGAMPSTSGVVNFHPISEPSSGNHEGDVYYDSSSHTLRYFTDSVNPGWRTVGGQLKIAIGSRSSPSSSPAGAITALVGDTGDFVDYASGGLWGLLCNSSKGWQVVGCTTHSGGSPDFDLWVTKVNNNTGCFSDDPENSYSGGVQIICAKIE